MLTRVSGCYSMGSLGEMGGGELEKWAVGREDWMELMTGSSRYYWLGG